jgi:5-methyltetrahydropteroyltriglutamate--homocysteine methyltransferase
VDMIAGRDRILTTHVGSLPRNDALSDLLVSREEGKPIDEGRLAKEMDVAVRQIVAKQAAEKFAILSFRGTLHAEESLFSWV